MSRKTSQKPDAAPAPQRCPECYEFVGRGYPTCASCREVVEQPIRAAWQALLQAKSITPGTPPEQELAAEVLERSDQYWWSEVEAAMRHTDCPGCHGPLGYGSPTCKECTWHSDMFWGRDGEIDPDGRIHRNEHTLRIILRGLGQAHRHSSASLEGWRLFLPFILHSGSNPVGSRDDVRFAHAINAWIKAGRGRDLANCHSIEEMYAITRRGRK